MFRNTAVSLIVVAVLVSAVGCVGSRSGQVYSRDDARRAQTVEMGTVENVSEVKIEGTRSGTGAVVGGIAGGVAGSTVGSGRSAGLIGAAIGALAGGGLGAAAEEGITRKRGLELTVNLDGGRTVIVVQEADEQFAVGNRVRVITAADGVMRVRH